MSDTPQSPFGITPVDFTNTLTAAARQASEKMQQQSQAMQPMIKAFTAAAEAIARDPHALMQRNLQLYQSHLALYANMVEKMMGKPTTPVATPEKDDKRFSNPAWDIAFFDLLKQSYLLTSNWLMSNVAASQGMDKHTQEQAVFYTRLFVEALSPSNFLLTNPEALSTALATKGESLLQGFQNVLHDIQQGKISMTDYDQFEVGKNLATTPGTVVFRNKLVELIQYTPTTKQVHATPLLISPPWINRYYILDLRAENSFVKYMVDQGYQVFMISWKNPDASYKDVGFEDYITDGLLAALDATLDITGQPSANMIGYCIGGTLLASAMAVLNAKAKGGKEPRINSATFFTTLVDFSEAGELSVFIDDEQLSKLEAQMEKDGVLDGRSMAGTFSALRANDLVWSFVVNNYLLGKQPFPFDILYWNDDSTRMPCAMHTWYLRNLYLENALVQKGKLKLLGTPVDITNLTQPLYMVSAINDHITPWASCYGAFAKMQSDNKTYVLSKAGHVAGVVNPPTPAGKPVKRSFWTAPAGGAKSETWLKSATETPDSWWPHYAAWLKPLSGADVAAPAKPGNGKYKSICAAPGTYVVEK